MPSKVVLISSLHFSVGLAKELSALAGVYRRLGYEPALLLASQYATTDVFAKETVHFTGGPTNAPLRKIVAEVKPAVTVIYNIDVANLRLIREVRKASPTGHVVHMLHEPYVKEKRAYGYPAAVKLLALDWLQAALVRASDRILVPSEHALDLFRARFHGATVPVHVTPLCIPDASLENATRDCLTMVGHLNKARGADVLLDLARDPDFAATGLKIRLVSSSPLPSGFQALVDSPIFENAGAGPLTDDAIAHELDRSVATLLPHTVAAQSGVIPLAYRQGTPVIVRNIPGLTQDVTPDITGAVLRYDFDSKDLSAALRMIQSQISDMTRAARDRYETRFSPDAACQSHGWINEPFA